MTSLLPTLSGILLLAALTALPASALTLGELEKSYDDKQTEIRLEKDKSMDGLKQSYLGALARIMTKYQRAGRLDEVLLVKDEMKDISNEKWPLLALPKKISLEVAAPRKIYLKKYIKIGQNAARQTAETADKMLALLEKQAVNLTKKDDLQQALLARQIKADIESDTKLTDARKLLANVMSDGRSRPALRIRRFGDNKEVIVRYDMRGKISTESPVSNVEEADKSIGNTSARNLGEFVGAKGYEVDAYVMFDKTFDDEDHGELNKGRFTILFRQKNQGSAGMALVIPQNIPVAGAMYIPIPVTMPTIPVGGTTQISANYFIPKTNKGIVGFKLIQGMSGGSPLGDKVFSETEKWTTETLSSDPASDSDRLLLYPQISPDEKQADLTGDRIILGALKIKQIKFSAFIVQRLGENGVIVENFEDTDKQPSFATNGQILGN